MELNRSEIIPGVFLNHIYSDKFKSACMSVSLLTPLKRETASMNALIPYVLKRGTTNYDTMEKLNRRMEELYGSATVPLVRKIGEMQMVGIYASFPEDRFLPKGEGVLEDAVKLLGEMLLSPVTRGGLFLQDYVESERDKLLDVIKGRINSKPAYAIKRCIAEMCCYEDYAVDALGDEESCGSINYKSLSKHYKELLRSSPVEIVYCGSAGEKELTRILREALSSMPRGEIDYEELGTDIRMNAVEDEVRLVEEQLATNQAQLLIGCRLGDCMDEPDYAALAVFNSVLGASAVSKLFTNVREKMSLCYTATSILDRHKGTLLMYAGIDAADFEKARDASLAQLDEIRLGHVSGEELAMAKAGIISDMKACSDHPAQLEGYYFSAIVDGIDCTPEEYAELVSAVTVEDITEIAAGVELDLIYLLKGDGNDEDDED